jgi:hypothetical protein
MSVLPVELRPRPAARAATRRGFWRGLAQRLDALAAYPTKHAISEQELRRVDDDIKRCRQLMFKKSQHCRDAKFDRVRMLRAPRAIKAR